MNLEKMPQSEIQLQFAPLKPLPEVLPPLFWNNVQLGGFQSKEPKVFLNSNFALHECIGALYPDLTIPELSRILLHVKTYALPLDFAKLMKTYQFHFAEDVENRLIILAQRSSHFQNWCSEKKIGIKDLSALTILPITPDLDRALDQIVNWNVGKNEGVSSIELLCECAALDRFVDPAQFKTFYEFLEKLKSVRYPETYKRDQFKNKMRYELPWPVGVQTKLDRQGDRAKIEIKFHVSKAEELEKILTQLNSVAVKMKQTQVLGDHSNG